MDRLGSRGALWQGGRRRTGLGIAVAALAALGTGTARAQEPETEVRWHDVRALLSLDVTDVRDVDLRLPVDASHLDNIEPDRYGVPLESVPDLWDYGLVEVVLDTLAQLDPDAEAFVDLRGGRLRVEGNAAGHARVEAILGDLTRHYLDTVELELHRLDATALPADLPVVLAADRAAALLDGSQALEVHRKSVRTDRRARLGSEGLGAYLLDYDVEVAQRARVGDPQVSIVYAGATFGAIVRETTDGRFLVRLWGRDARPEGELQRVVLDDFAGVPIEQPTVQAGLYTSSATVEDGGAALLAGGDGTAWVVRVRRSDLRTEGGGGERALFLPLGELAAQPLLVQPPFLPRTAPSGGWDPGDHWILADLDVDLDELPLTPQELFDIALEARDRSERTGSLCLLGHTLYARGDRQLLNEIRTALADAARGLSARTVDVELRYDLLDSEAAAAFSAALASGGPDAAVAGLGRSVRGACRTGDGLMLVAGSERMYLCDTDVEIAEGAAIGDPILAGLFDGHSFWCRPTPAGEGALSAWIDLVVQAPGAPTRQLPTAVWEPRELGRDSGNPEPVDTFEDTRLVELPSTAIANVRSLVRVQEGAWRLLGLTRLGGSELTLAAVVRMSYADDGADG